MFFFSSYYEATGEIVNSFFLLFWIHGHGRISVLEVKLFCFAYVVIVSQFFLYRGPQKPHGQICIIFFLKEPFMLDIWHVKSCN